MAFENYRGLMQCTHCKKLYAPQDMAMITEKKGIIQLEHRLCPKCWLRYAHDVYPRELQHIWQQKFMEKFAAEAMLAEEDEIDAEDD